MQIKHIISYLETIAPTQLQESYDNAGLIVGNQEKECSGVLISLDVTEKVVEEAIAQGMNLIVAHHPIVFKGLKRFNGKNYVERVVISAIKNDIAIYAIHTNLDNVKHGVNQKICDILGLENCKILLSKPEQLKKLITFIPLDHLDQVSQALFNAGAGQIGNYDSCSYQIEGTGTFKANNDAQPFVGENGTLHTEKEIRFESIFPSHLESVIISALKNAHPYEEVAFDIISLHNKNENIGAGMVGNLPIALDSEKFVNHVKNAFQIKTFKATPFFDLPIKKVAVCGGAGSFILNAAKAHKADVFITSDFKYHEFFDAENDITIIDVGHYESERFTIDLLYGVLSEKFPTFALLKSQVNTNPVNYF